ncbi:hypothetical protein ACHQM5_029128 [Ranunculus cassubicifolius]
MFFSLSHKSFIYCQIDGNQWIEKGLVPINEISKLVVFDLSHVTCRGKVYVFAIPDAIFVIDVHDNFATKLYDNKTLLFSIPEAIKAKNFYLESCGEIFRVVQHHLKQSDEVISFDVWKIDFATMDYVKVDNLGNRIFLLGYTSTSLSSTELQMKGNFIYFYTAKETYLNKFEMEDGTITTTQPGGKKFSNWKGPFWIVPNCKFKANKESAKPEVAEIDPRNEGGSWRKLMPELVELIISKLLLADCVRTRLTSKAWMPITPPIRSYTLIKQSEYKPDQLPWFLSFPKKNTGLCNLRHPIYSDTYIMEVPELEGAIVRHVKYGWWLMSQGDSILFFNPSTREIIKLPARVYTYDFVTIAFSAPPTCSDFIVFGHSCSADDAVNVAFYRKREDYWDSFWIDTPSFTFLPSECSPVFCDGVFYCLGKDGKLALFYPDEENKNDMWKLQPKAVVTEALSPSALMLNQTSSRSFIMEHENEIFSVFTGVWGKKVSVFKLDKSQMKWDKLESLGDKVFFLSHAATIVAPAGLKGIENRIYFPRFDGKDNLFYSLSTGKYHCFGEKDSRTSWLNSSKNWHCAWTLSA